MGSSMSVPATSAGTMSTPPRKSPAATVQALAEGPCQTPDALNLSNIQGGFSPRAITRPNDPEFQAGYDLIEKRFSADLVDPIAIFQKQLQEQDQGQLGKNTYRFLVIHDPEPRMGSGGTSHGPITPQKALDSAVAGVATFNYLAKSNIVFENYFVSKEGLDPNKALLSAMTEAGELDARQAKASLSGIVVEAEQKEIPFKRALGYLSIEELDYMQPPLTPDGKPVKLPLMIKVVNADDQGFVRDRDGKTIVGIEADKIRQIVEDLYHSVYDKQAADPHHLPSKEILPQILKSLEGKENVPLK